MRFAKIVTGKCKFLFKHLITIFANILKYINFLGKHQCYFVSLWAEDLKVENQNYFSIGSKA